MEACDPGVGGVAPRRLRVFSAGFLRQRRIRRVLELSGLKVSLGLPKRTDAVGVWGRRTTAARGQWIAAWKGVDLITVEDGFLRSLMPGDRAPLSLIIDDVGIYFDGARPSRLEQLIQDGGLETQAERARSGIDALREGCLSKYNPPPQPLLELPDKFVLVIDQTRGDAAITGAGAGAETFLNMLAAARNENPGAQILVKSHPETAAGTKAGHIGIGDLREGERLLGTFHPPWPLLAKATAVYSVSSLMGYEGVLAGVPVRCFGDAFYAGWGLTFDERTVPRRTARPSVAEIFAATHLRYPVYYDPYRDRLCSFEEAVETLRALTRSAWPDPGEKEETFVGVRLWKRRAVRAFRPGRKLRFAETETIHGGGSQRVWAWASAIERKEVARLQGKDVRIGLVEDGFLRSHGLGAALTEPLSLVFDECGIYFDPSGPSDLENLIGGPTPGPRALERAARLRMAIVASGLSKYNTGKLGTLPTDSAQNRILVPGQVENDASVLRGGGKVRTNLELLEAARKANPNANLLYKPHPDVEAGLRPGRVSTKDLTALADHVIEGWAAAAALEAADEIWTITSLIGFEALLRGKPVTCLGTPFYAGWGLTTDVGPLAARRTARPTLDHLIWAVLIAYPVYRDPVSGLPCPPEVVVERLASSIPGRRVGALSRLQGLLAGQSWLWRR